MFSLILPRRILSPSFSSSLLSSSFSTSSPLLTQQETRKRKFPDRLDVQKSTTKQNCYESNNLWLPPLSKGVYGGHVVALALRSALLQVGEDSPSRGFLPQSLHCNFLQPATATKIAYEVKRIKEGGRYEVYMVEAYQNDAMVFYSTITFQRYETNYPEFDHQTPLTPPPPTSSPSSPSSSLSSFPSSLSSVPPPEEVMSDKERFKRCYEDERTPTQYRDWFRQLYQANFLIECHNLDPPSFLSPTPSPAYSHFWLKMKEELGGEGEGGFSVEEEFVFSAFLSDWQLPFTALRPHGLIYPVGIVMASVDHNIWWHTPNIRASDWLFCHGESPRAQSNRGMVYGRYLDVSGDQVMTVMQEVSVRPRRKK